MHKLVITRTTRGSAARAVFKRKTPPLDVQECQKPVDINFKADHGKVAIVKQAIGSIASSPKQRALHCGCFDMDTSGHVIGSLFGMFPSENL